MAREIEEKLELYPRALRNEIMQEVFSSLMTSDTDLEEGLEAALIETVGRVFSEEYSSAEDIAAHKRAIGFVVEADEAKYENLEALIGVCEFIVFLARKTYDQNRITGMEYISLRRLLRAVGFPHLGLTEYPDELHGQIQEIEEMALDKEIARRELLAKLQGDDEALALASALDLDKPIATSMEQGLRDETTQRQFFDLLDEFCRFGALTTHGSSNMAKVMECILREFEMLPQLNGGYSLLSVVDRNPDESIEEFNARFDDELRHISMFLIERLKDHPVAPRFIVAPIGFGDLNVTGLLPSYILKTLDERPEVQAFLNNMGKTATSQIA